MTQQEALFEYCLRLGDNGLILGHRLSEWCGHGPILEEDIALTNIALDLIGQCRMALSYAGTVEGKNRSEDDLAYLRDVYEFRNVLLVEQPNGHYGDTITRQFLFDAFNFALHQRLQFSSDEHIVAYARKAIKEITYHARHSSEWMIRLGDGTEESHNKVQESLNDLWMYTGEMFESDEVDQLMVDAGVGVDLKIVKQQWDDSVGTVLAEATLTQPEDGWMQSGGKKGTHSEKLGFLLAEMQFMQRAYPGATW
ncbi:MAG: 1,2-phenylacetyl-CoA epoxidase subunit PaaC [Salibacteraceae bacterium]